MLICKGRRGNKLAATPKLIPWKQARLGIRDNNLQFFYFVCEETMSLYKRELIYRF